MSTLPRYDWTRSYEWNYARAPDPVEVDEPDVPGEWNFCGRRVPSPLGVPAGPLLNGKWCLYYASLGFDVLTYKTVRSRAHGCYEMPNLLPVTCGQLAGTERDLPARAEMAGSWAVSFGMPSRSPDVWRRDVLWTRQRLGAEKLLVVSVVGTIQPGWTVDQLAEDYAVCAAWAVESGADAIEANLSCPNVSTCDGQLYQSPLGAHRVAQAIRSRVGSRPLVLKVGHFTRPAEAAELIEQTRGLADGFSMTNSIATTVVGADGHRQFGGQRRGICGTAIRDASLAQVRLCAELLAARPRGSPGSADRREAVTPRLIGVGGISTAAHVQSFLAAGAHSVHLATAAMQCPEVALQLRLQLAGREAVDESRMP